MSARHDRNAELHSIMHGDDPVAAKAAREALIVENMGLVAHVIAAYSPPLVGDDDATSAGTLGLIAAVDKWDPERATLATVARWWIRQAISRAQDNESLTVRQPAHRHQARRSLTAAIRHLGPDATDDQLADFIGVDPAEIPDLRGDLWTTASLDRRMIEGEGDDLGSRIGEYDDVSRIEVDDLSARILAALPERESFVLRGRLAGQTLGDLSAEVGMTRQGIAAVERRARALAQHPCLGAYETLRGAA